MAEELRIVLRNYGKVDPLNIDTYIAQVDISTGEAAVWIRRP